MLACMDVDYRGDEAVAACILFHDWMDATGAAELVRCIERVEPYQPGQFYKRELPCLLTVLADVPHPLRVIVIDGYVWLSDASTCGLGGYLYEALGRTTPVVGVAKTRFAGATAAQPVFRGGSLRPLYVTAAGMDVDEAVRRVRTMHGEHRLPTLLQRVDQLCRCS